MLTRIFSLYILLLRNIKKYIYTFKCKIIVFFPEIFLNYWSSTTIILSGDNKISRINTDLKHLSELSVLRLDGNQLTKIPTTKLIPAGLKELTLCSNNIGSSSVSSTNDLEGYRNLKKLKLSGNKGIRYVLCWF